MTHKAPETWGEYWLHTLRHQPRLPWFGVAVLALVVVISARFLLVTGFPRTATADPRSGGVAGPKTPTKPAKPAESAKPDAPGAHGAGVR